MNPLYPWLQKDWAHLCHYKSQNRIPHTLLIAGNKGLGKSHLAEYFAYSLLCEKPNLNGLPCGLCSSCLLIKSKTHPDFIYIAPNESGKAIGIDLIRTLLIDLQLKPQYDSFRVVIINPADLMNDSATNALLKYLEEPNDRNINILISDNPAKLPATILSRCQKHFVHTPAKETIIAWLKQENIERNLDVLIGISHNSPLLAMHYAKENVLSSRNDCFKSWLGIAKQNTDPIHVAEIWLSLPHSALLFWLSSWIIDLIKCFYQVKPDNFYNPDFFKPLKELSGELDLRNVFKHYDLLLFSRERLGSQINKQLLFEDILIKWSELNRNSMP